MTAIEQLESFAKGGPFIGPQGGKWADAAHTISWKEGESQPSSGGSGDLQFETVTEESLQAMPIGTVLVAKNPEGKKVMGGKIIAARKRYNDEIGRGKWDFSSGDAHSTKKFIAGDIRGLEEGAAGRYLITFGGTEWAKTDKDAKFLDAPKSAGGGKTEAKPEPEKPAEPPSDRFGGDHDKWFRKLRSLHKKERAAEDAHHSMTAPVNADKYSDADREKAKTAVEAVQAQIKGHRATEPGTLRPDSPEGKRHLAISEHHYATSQGEKKISEIMGSEWGSKRGKWGGGAAGQAHDAPASAYSEAAQAHHETSKHYRALAELHHKPEDKQKWADEAEHHTKLGHRATEMATTARFKETAKKREKPAPEKPKEQLSLFGVKSMSTKDENFAKADEGGGGKEGEGSRGGHIIGHTSGGKPIYAASHEKYQAQHKAPKWNIKPRVLDEPKLARRQFPDMDKKDHLEARDAHVQHREAQAAEHGKTYRAAVKKHGPSQGSGTAGGAEPHFPEKTKNKLRALARGASDADRAAQAHHAAAGKRMDSYPRSGRAVTYSKSMSAIDALDDFAKAGGGERAGHKYQRRERGKAGKWIYFYQDAQGKRYHDISHTRPLDEQPAGGGSSDILPLDHSIRDLGGHIAEQLKSAGVNPGNVKIQQRGGDTHVNIKGIGEIHISVSDNDGGKDSGKVRVEGGAFRGKSQSKTYDRTEGNIKNAIQEGISWLKEDKPAGEAKASLRDYMAEGPDGKSPALSRKDQEAKIDHHRAEAERFKNIEPNMREGTVRDAANSAMYAHQAAASAWQRSRNSMTGNVIKKEHEKAKKLADQATQAEAHYKQKSEDFKALKDRFKTRSEGEKSMTGIEELEMFAKAQAMPTSNALASIGGSGPEQGEPMAGVGKQTGSIDTSAGPPINAPVATKKKLSDDDEDVEQQLKSTRKKPLETLKSVSTPNDQREMVAHEQAVAVSRLQKGEDDVAIGGPGPAPTRRPEPLAKGIQWNQGDDSQVEYSTNADELASRFAKGGEFYEGGENPSITRTAMMVNDRINCPACRHVMVKALTVCPSCGAGAGSPRVAVNVESAGEVVEKSRGSVLRPRRVVDVTI